MKQCPNCKTKYNDEVNFCGKCGEKLIPKTNQSRKILISIFGLLTIVCIGMLGYMYMDKKPINNAINAVENEYNFSKFNDLDYCTKFEITQDLLDTTGSTAQPGKYIAVVANSRVNDDITTYFVAMDGAKPAKIYAFDFYLDSNFNFGGESKKKCDEFVAITMVYKRIENNCKKYEF